ncbi:MAG: CrcB family protein [Cytophagaceae bacterium]|nr:CrcB family protein [Cytophagaceae bacterium]MDW8457385.1 CrcB family protein [Cytophagaceae bacterium]
MKIWFYIFTGGGLGSLLRFYTSAWANPLFSALPAGTFLSNMISSFLLGIASAAIEYAASGKVFFQYFVIAGLCGGYSTFSTFSYENLQLLKQNQYAMFIMNTCINVSVCILSIMGGYKTIKILL